MVINMKTTTAKRMIDSFHQAKYLIETMPALEKGYTPLSIRVIDCIHSLGKKGNAVHPSEISDALRQNRSGIARTLRQLESNGAIIRKTDPEDGRSVIIVLSEEGERIYKIYVQEYYRKLTKKLQDIPDEEIETMTKTIAAVYEAMEKGSGNDGKGHE